jgi:hypothetical protein
MRRSLPGEIGKGVSPYLDLPEPAVLVKNA